MHLWFDINSTDWITKWMSSFLELRTEFNAWLSDLQYLEKFAFEIIDSKWKINGCSRNVLYFHWTFATHQSSSHYYPTRNEVLILNFKHLWFKRLKMRFWVIVKFLCHDLLLVDVEDQVEDSSSNLYFLWTGNNSLNTQKPVIKTKSLNAGVSL